MKRKLKKTFKVGVYVGCGFILYGFGVVEGVKYQQRVYQKKIDDLVEQSAKDIEKMWKETS